ncbi:MAG: uracil-DNA glycosylase [Candidatus Paceibacterota bacterium]
MTKIEKMQAITDEITARADSSLYAYRIENNYIPVIGEGSLNAKVFFIGEAPGKKEGETGKPFCGRSGKFLDEMLTSISLERKNVYITSVVKDRPQDNRDPTQKEIDLYGPYLLRQLEIVKPKIIVLLGRISMKYMFMSAGIENELDTIGEMHGKVYKGKLSYGEVIFLPLYHPAAALYNPKNKAVLMEDFKVVKKFIEK